MKLVASNRVSGLLLGSPTDPQSSCTQRPCLVDIDIAGALGLCHKSTSEVWRETGAFLRPKARRTARAFVGRAEAVLTSSFFWLLKPWLGNPRTK
jgi:hypothetical protein